jgi:hypothetical protein
MSCYKHGDELSVSIKRGEILDYLQKEMLVSQSHYTVKYGHETCGTQNQE